jgi:hypothetical protein
MAERSTYVPSTTTTRLSARARLLPADPVSRALRLIFLGTAAFYLLIAETSRLLVLRGREKEPYNQLANAFLHLHLSVGRAPAALLRLADPYDPAQNYAVMQHVLLNDESMHDFALYHGHMFLTWGPAPVIVLLVPMHLLGLEPSASVVVALFSIVGTGFALAALRVVLRQIGSVTMWMCVLAAFALVLSSVVPYVLRRPAVYEAAIASGYCFAMAAVWLALSAVADSRRASLARLALMSLCIGLAAGSRPTLGCLALVLVPVYLSLRSTRPRGGLLLALLVPAGVCALLLMAYNQARFGSPLEYGGHYVLASDDEHTGHWAQFSNVLPGLWYYLVSLPRPLALFPFISLGPPPMTYPWSLPAGYTELSSTGGLLPMAPILVFLPALPWVWRRRPALLGPLAGVLLALAGAGLICLLFLAYQFYGTAERYETDFITLLLFGALAAWLALSKETRGRRRRLVRTGGSVLAVWGCLTGLAISFIGSANLLAITLPTAWVTLENVSMPLSTAITEVAGRPVLAEVSAPGFIPRSNISFTSLSVGTAPFTLSPSGQANLTIVSPGSRSATLVVSMLPGAALGAGASLWVVLTNPERWRHTYPLPARGGVARIPVQLGIGLNRLVLSPLAGAIRLRGRAAPSTQPLLVVRNLALAG